MHNSEAISTTRVEEGVRIMTPPARGYPGQLRNPCQASNAELRRRPKLDYFV